MLAGEVLTGAQLPAQEQKPELEVMEGAMFEVQREKKGRKRKG